MKKKIYRIISNNWFGDSVAIYGNTALVGAYGANSNKGSAYVFAGSSSNWSQQAKLVANDGWASHRFGDSGESPDHVGA